MVWEFTDTSLIELDEEGSEPVGKVYNYDMVFNPEQDTNYLYEKQCRPIVESAMKGFNGTVFAYGQTSSGKTWTLMGDGQDGDHPGVTILAIRDIFEYIKKNPSVEWHVTCCYMEIYNETITDLLQPDRKIAYNLPVMEDKVFGPMPKGILTVGVHDTKHCMDVLESGEKNRSFAATDMNANSSRSHTLFRLRIQGKTASNAIEVANMKANMHTVADDLFATQSTLEADRCSLFLLDHKAKEMYIQAGDITLRLPFGAGIAGTVAETGETINIPDAYQDDRFNRGIDKKTGYRTKSILCMAVRGVKKIVGVVQYINKSNDGEFDDDDVKKVENMITKLGPLIEQTQMMTKVTTTSGLNLVDLAGSERADKTNAKGAQLKEGANINKSLMMLGRCIAMLSSGTKGHIPFRNSKLTRLLSTSLGGNAKTAIMCAFSPASRNRPETISTFQFASRAKTIVNVAKCNKKKETAAMSAAYEEEIRKLKEHMLSQNAGGMNEEEKSELEKEKALAAKQHEKEVEYLKAEQNALKREHEQHMEKLRVDQEQFEQQLELHRKESVRMKKEANNEAHTSSKRIAELVSRNSLHQVRSRKKDRDLQAKERELAELIEKQKNQSERIAQLEQQASKSRREHKHALAVKQDEGIELEKRHRQESIARDNEMEALQATIDGMVARLAVQNDALTEARQRGDEANKNSLLTTGLVTNLEREVETMKTGIKVYRDFFVEWQKNSAINEDSLKF